MNKLTSVISILGFTLICGCKVVVPTAIMTQSVEIVEEINENENIKVSASSRSSSSASGDSVSVETNTNISMVIEEE